MVDLCPEPEPLLRDLGLGSRFVGGSVGVNEATSELAVLGGCSDGRAYAEAAAADLGAAGASAVGIGDASASGELLALAVTDILGAGGVGSEGHGGDGEGKSNSEGDANHVCGWND